MAGLGAEAVVRAFCLPARLGVAPCDLQTGTIHKGQKIQQAACRETSLCGTKQIVNRQECRRADRSNYAAFGTAGACAGHGAAQFQ